MRSGDDVCDALVARYRSPGGTRKVIESLSDLDDAGVAGFLHCILRDPGISDIRMVASAPFAPLLSAAVRHVRSLARNTDTGDGPSRQDTARWIALSTLHQKSPGIPMSQFYAIKGMADGFGGEDRREFYGAVVAEMRREDIIHQWRLVVGWSALLAEASKVEFNVLRSPTTALQLGTESWECLVSEPQTMQIAKTRGYAAMCCAMYLGYCLDEEAHRLREVLDWCDRARDELSRLGDPGSRIHLLRVAFAEANLWNVARKSKAGHIGRLAGAAQARDVLRSALCGYLDVDDLESSRLVERVAEHIAGPRLRGRNVVVRILNLLSELCYELGKHAESEDWLDIIGRAAHDPVSRWHRELTRAVISHNSTERIRTLERVLSTFGFDAFDRIPISQQQRLVGRFAFLAGEVSRALLKEGLHTSAWFWELVRHRWNGYCAAISTRSPDTPAGAADDDLAGLEEIDEPDLDLGSPDPDDEAGLTDLSGAAAVVSKAVDRRAAVEAQARQVELQLQRENPIAVVLSLTQLLVEIQQSPEAGREALERIARLSAESAMVRDAVGDGYDVTSMLEPGVTSVKFLLALQLRLCQTYAPHLTPECLKRHAKYGGFGTEERLGYLDRCSAAAERLGRLNVAASSCVAGIRIAAQAGLRERLDTCVSRLGDILSRVAARPLGAADIVESTYFICKRVDAVVVDLVALGFHEHAYRVAELVEGIQSTLFITRPQLLEEYELVERTAASVGLHDAMESLFDIMVARIVSTDRAIHASNQGEGALDAESHPGVICRFIDTGSKLVAVGRACAPGGDAEYFGVVFTADGGLLSDLIDLVWFHLRPTRRARDARSLSYLYEEFVAPIMDHVPQGARLTLVPRGRFSELPIHAARSPEGYLVERNVIAYKSIGTTAPAVGTAGSLHSLVCGWTPQIEADRESREVARVLRRNKVAVELPKRAAAGREMILDAAGQFDILHVAAHGSCFNWPNSLSSEVALSSNAVITAAEWLRTGCSARFVFLNACSIGQPGNHRGDLNGFPLAIKIRGAETVVAAIGYVAPKSAKNYAFEFYARFERMDSLAAYREAIVDIIRGGHPPHDWAPFIHDGPGFSASGLQRSGT